MSAKKRWRPLILVVLASIILVLGACGKTKDANPADNANQSETTENTGGMDGMDHGSMNHNGSGEVPEGLKTAENPTYAVGTQAIIESDHMPGMKGATATIVGAYNTTVYSISYTPHRLASAPPASAPADAKAHTRRNGSPRYARRTWSAPARPPRSRRGLPQHGPGILT